MVPLRVHTDEPVFFVRPFVPLIFPVIEPAPAPAPPRVRRKPPLATLLATTRFPVPDTVNGAAAPRASPSDEASVCVLPEELIMPLAPRVRTALLVAVKVNAPAPLAKVTFVKF